MPVEQNKNRRNSKNNESTSLLMGRHLLVLLHTGIDWVGASGRRHLPPPTSTPSVLLVMQKPKRATDATINQSINQSGRAAGPPNHQHHRHYHYHFHHKKPTQDMETQSQPSSSTFRPFAFAALKSGFCHSTNGLLVRTTS